MQSQLHSSTPFYIIDASKISGQNDIRTVDFSGVGPEKRVAELLQGQCRKLRRANHLPKGRNLPRIDTPNIRDRMASETRHTQKQLELSPSIQHFYPDFSRKLSLASTYDMLSIT